MVSSQNETKEIGVSVCILMKNRNHGSYETGRSTFIQRFTWNVDGTPNFGTPVGWGEPVVVPSGE